MRDLKYKPKTFKLSDEVLFELDNRIKDHKSWNLLFEHLLKIGKKNENNRKRKELR